MERRTLRLAVGEASDGGETTIYYQAGQPRVIAILYGGEMGQLTDRYYLAGRHAYVLQRERLRYAKPLTVQSDAPVVSRLPSVLYVCGQSELSQFDPKEVEHLKAALDSALARASRNR